MLFGLPSRLEAMAISIRLEAIITSRLPSCATAVPGDRGAPNGSKDVGLGQCSDDGTHLVGEANGVSHLPELFEANGTRFRVSSITWKWKITDHPLVKGNLSSKGAIHFHGYFRSLLLGLTQPLGLD